MFSNSSRHRWLHDGHGSRSYVPAFLTLHAQACRCWSTQNFPPQSIPPPQSLANADWSLYETYLQSRPEEAELSAIRMLLTLCREYEFRLHIVHLSASQALPDLRRARSQGFP